MKLKKLKLQGFRVFDQAEFEFNDGMNLIVGINGVGKSSVLDALRVMFSQVLPKISKLKIKPESFKSDDVSLSANSMAVDMKFTVLNEDNSQDQEMSYLVYKAALKPTQSTGYVRNNIVSKPDVKSLEPNDKELLHNLSESIFETKYVVYYSTRRSIPSLAKISNLDDSLRPRELRLSEFADWWMVQDEFGFIENQNYINSIVELFIDGYKNLRAVREPKKTMVLDKNEKTLDLWSLSEGERGILSLVLDLGRRICVSRDSIALSYSRDAIVLIDELDLHLHPRWQRTIVEKLTKTFPNFQFIATTHSPQIVGEVSPENIIILEEGKPPYRPDQSLGMDTNWILRFLMGTEDRNVKSRKELDRIAKLIENEEYDKAESLIDRARLKSGETPDLVRLQSRIDSIKILGK